jgi:hypothetical protein
MASSKITFPLIGTVKGSRVWRNTETGVEIIKGVNFAEVGLYYVAVPTLGADARAVVTARTTLAAARADAARVAATMREEIDLARAEALAEVAEREAEREIQAVAGSIAIECRPAAVTEILNRAELETSAVACLALVRQAKALDARLRADIYPADVPAYDGNGGVIARPARLAETLNH